MPDKTSSRADQVLRMERCDPLKLAFDPHVPVALAAIQLTGVAQKTDRCLFGVIEGRFYRDPAFWRPFGRLLFVLTSVMSPPARSCLPGAGSPDVRKQRVRRFRPGASMPPERTPAHRKTYRRVRR